MLKRWLMMILLLVLLLGGITAVKYGQFQAMEAQFSQPPPPAVVEVEAVSQRQWRPTIRAVGSLTAVNGVSVTSELPGLVKAILVQSGQEVEKGDVLVQLDDTVELAELNGLEADQKLAQVQLKRARELLPKKAISQSEYDEILANHDAVSSSLKKQRVVVDKMRISAPFKGLAGIRLVDIGQYLTPGEGILRLNALDELYFDYALPERYFTYIHEGQQIVLELTAYPGRSFSGVVEAIDSGVDEGTRSIRIRARVVNEKRELRPGMFAEVKTYLGDALPVLTVPRTAISFNTYGDFVFRIEEEGSSLLAKRVQVETGEVRAGQVVVKKGLKPGERVISAGVIKVRDGQPVRVASTTKE